MARKKRIYISDLVKEIKSDALNAQSEYSKGTSTEKHLPSIVEFINSPEFLDFGPDNDQTPTPTPVQLLSLKAFYRGSPGNENLKLTQEEIDICHSLGFNDDENGDILGKWDNGEIFRELVLVWGRRCLTGDSLIPQKDGSWITINQLLQDRKTHSWTYDFKNDKNSFIDYVEVIPQGKDMVYEVETYSGNKIKANKDHRFLKKSGWSELSKLSVGDQIALTDSIPVFGNSNKISKEEAFILGAMTADGCCTKETLLTCSNSHLLYKFKNCLKTIDSNLQIKNDLNTKANSKKYQFRISNKKKNWIKYFNKKRQQTMVKSKENALKTLLKKWDLWGKKSKDKTIPEELFKCPKEVIDEYLSGLFSCDGNIGLKRNLKRKNNNLQFQFTSINKSQVELIQRILLKYNIFAKIRKKRVKSHIKCEKDITRHYNTYCYILDINRKDYVLKLINNINFIGKEKYIKLIHKHKDNIKNIKHNKFYYSKIKNIRKIGYEDVYDLQVSEKEELQNFVSNLFINHNSGKDWCTGIIAAYEACRLLEISNGDPYSFYNLDRGNEITILTVAGASGQASLAFNEIESKIFNCKYFEDKYVPDGIGQTSIYLLTSKDKEENEKRKEKKLPLKKGSICIQVGHSNSSSLRGKQIYVCILDEVAFYHNTAGASSGDQIYQSLSPSVKTFIRREKIKDENGEEKEIKHFDGKMILISSPYGQEGLLWNLFSKANQVKHRLVLRAATWDVYPNFTEEELREEFPDRSEEAFMTEFGAQFSGTAGNNFFVRDDVISCFSPGMSLQKIGQPGIAYFIHLDPATSSHNYALCMAHKENYVDPENKNNNFRIVVDLLKYWYPQGGSINVEDVDNYILWLKDRFYIAKLTYDQHRSENSIKVMRKVGLPAHLTRFTLSYKMKIYQNLYNLITSKRLIIPDDGSDASKLLKSEMIYLQKKDNYQGWRVFPKKDAEVNTDDLVDSLAGATYACLSKTIHNYPTGIVANLPLQDSSNQQVWRGPQGPIGTGTPSQIENMHEKMGVPRVIY